MYMYTHVNTYDTLHSLLLLLLPLALTHSGHSQTLYTDNIFRYFLSGTEETLVSLRGRARQFAAKAFVGVS